MHSASSLVKTLVATGLVLPTLVSGEFTAAKIVKPLPLGNCVHESRLADRGDIVFCEPWDEAGWWRELKAGGHGYLRNVRQIDPIPADAESVSRTEIVSEGCVSGSCLKVHMLKGDSGALALHWPLKNAGIEPEQLFMRYYLKLGSDWNVDLCHQDTGELSEGGGKFPGLADVRVDDSATGEEQCGNGGATADGINCWSGRAQFRHCFAGESRPYNICSSGAVTRFGYYLYHARQVDIWGDGGFWDNEEWGQSYNGGSCESEPSNMLCGIDQVGNLGLDRWYRIEMQIKMNTPGQADGIARGWVDGRLAYDKTNVMFRLEGHDNLHVRTAWLNVHKGGDVPWGNCEDSAVYLDQLVLATDARVDESTDSSNTVSQRVSSAPGCSKM